MVVEEDVVEVVAAVEMEMEMEEEEEEEEEEEVVVVAAVVELCAVVGAETFLI